MTSGTNGTHRGDSVAEIEADIARTREELAATVDQLAARMDVKARAQDRVRTIRDSATDDAGRPTPTTLAVAVAAASGVALIAFLTWRRRR